MFAGYDLFREAKVRRFWARQPQSAWRPRLLERLYPYLERSPVSQRAMARQFFGQQLDQRRRARLRPRAALAGRRGAQAPALGGRPAPRIRGTDAVSLLKASLPAAFGSWTPLAQDQYLEVHTLLSGYLLSSQGDRMLMANSVEGRFPFLDRNVAALAESLPPAYKLRVLDEKHVLKRAAAALVPASILARKKQPYRAPDALSFASDEAREWIDEVASTRALTEAGVFSAAAAASVHRQVPRPRCQRPVLERRQHGGGRGAVDAARAPPFRPPSARGASPRLHRDRGRSRRCRAAQLLMLVHRLLEDSAGRQPDALALIDAKRRVTYAELDLLANRFANLYRDAGVARHDRVVIALDNSIDMVGAYLGTMKAGAVAVPLPAGPRSDRLAGAIQSCAPIAAVVDASMLAEDAAGQALAAVNRVYVSGRLNPGTVLPPSFTPLAPALAAAPAAPTGVRPIDLDLAAIIYTSGSTGEPRGVMLTHRNFTTNASSIVSYLELGPSDRVMCVLPFYYVYALSLLHTHLAVGGSVVIDNRFVFPNVVLGAMHEQEVTGFAGVPSTFALLLHRSAIDTWSCPSLRYVTQAGGAMSSSKIQEWCARGPKVPFYVMYGATEAAARLTYLDPARLADKLGSIGKAIPNVEIRVVKEDGSTTAANEVGELVARGANISLGYWNDPIETERRFDRFGYRTGDLGYADEDGYLFIVGRRHDMLKLGAHRVGAKEIEDVLQDCPAVLEAAVVGAPHDLLGEVAVAFVSVRDGFTASPELLEAFCRTRLASHKIPARFILLPELPKLGAVGKVDKAKLRADARARGGVSSQPA